MKDQRGKHSNHRKVPADDVDIIRKLITMFPAYNSHYSRSDSQKKYLNPDLNLSKMYRLYKTYCNEHGIYPQNESFYRKVSVEQFNISFHRPINDTFGKCNKLQIKIEVAKMKFLINA